MKGSDISMATQGRSDGVPIRMSDERHQCHACHQQHYWSRLSELGHLAPRAPCGRMPRELCQPRRPFHRPPAAAEHAGRGQSRLWSRLADGTISLCVPAADVQAARQAQACICSVAVTAGAVCAHGIVGAGVGLQPSAPHGVEARPGLLPAAAGHRLVVRHLHAISMGEQNRLVSLDCRAVGVRGRVYPSPPHGM